MLLNFVAKSNQQSMKLSHIIVLLMLTACATLSRAEDTELWHGEYTASWGKGLHLPTIEAYRHTGPGDKLKIEYRLTGSGSGTLKIALYTPWREYAYLSGLRGETLEWELTEEAVRAFIPGSIYIQGAGVVVTKVSLTGDHYAPIEYWTYEEPAPRQECVLGDLDTALYYGAERTGANKVLLHKGGAFGWYWDAPVDFSSCASITVKFAEPLTQNCAIALQYTDDLKSVARRNIMKGKSEMTVDLTRKDAAQLSEAHSLVLYSSATADCEMEIVGLSFTGLDGNEWKSSAAREIENRDAEIVAKTYFNLQGIRIAGPSETGVSIEMVRTSDGTVRVRKIMAK